MDELLSLIKLTPDQVFETICISGNVGLAEWFQDEIDVPPTVSLFKNCAVKGHFKMVKWLYSLLSDEDVLTERDIYECILKTKSFKIRKWLLCTTDYTSCESLVVRFISKKFKLGKYFLSERPEMREKIFLECCASNNLELAKLTQTMTVPEKSEIYKGFKLAALHGHIEICKWMYASYPSLDFKDEDIFRCACVNGHLNVAKWLYETYPGINIEINTFSKALKRGKLKTANWLYELLGHQHVASQFAEVCENGHLSTAKWIWKKVKECNETRSVLFSSILRYPICTIDSFLFDFIFRKVCEKGHISIAKWLYKIHPYTLEWASDVAHMNGHTELEKWLSNLRPQPMD